MASSREHTSFISCPRSLADLALPATNGKLGNLFIMLKDNGGLKSMDYSGVRLRSRADSASCSLGGLGHTTFLSVAQFPYL